MSEHNDNQVRRVPGADTPDRSPTKAVEHFVVLGRKLRSAWIRRSARHLGHWALRRIALPLIGTWRERLRRRRDYRKLLELDEHHLHDIGLTVEDVLRITGATPHDQYVYRRRRHRALLLD